MHDFLARLPKVELHLHIEGSLTPALMFELAAEQGIALPYATLEEVEAAYDFADLPAFLALYYQGMGVLNDESHFYRLAQDYFRRASADGVKHLELFFDPQAHLSRGVSLATQFAGLERACREAVKEFDITSALVPSFRRCHSAESARELFEALIPFESRFVGVGLDSAEIGNPPEKFTEVFQLAGSAAGTVSLTPAKRGRLRTFAPRLRCWGWSVSTTACAAWKTRRWSRNSPSGVSR